MFGDTPLIMVSDDKGLANLAQRISGAPVIGIDTESDSFYSYQEKVCLIQLSDLENDYIIDPLKIDDMSPLAPILADPKVVKILHGADYDVVCLGRDYGYEFHGVFDTLIAAQLLGMKRIGLADLIKRFFGHEIDKQYQRHDWSRRPLLQEHLDYARGDTHWLLAIRELMTRRLKAVGRMAHMREECALVAKREWQGRAFDPDGYLRIKKSDGLDDKGLRVLRRLYLYRDEAARKLDRPVFKVIPDSVLLEVARKRPTTSSGLDTIFPNKAAMKRRHGRSLIRLVSEGLEDDFEIPKKMKKPAKKKKKGPRPRLTGKDAERVLTALKNWRNRLVAREARLTPFTVASNGTLKAIASQRPQTLEQLRAVPDVRRWQVHDFGDQILDVLNKADPR